MTDPFNEGVTAYQNGQHLWENPYRSWCDHDDSYFHWYDGYVAAEAELLNEES